jgi:alkanesulfonate monooxygenase SsuD/methylene tetrahydromethanopterin reductase-like flavin-dependent oxidoreductase (luciferase family)
MGPVKFGALCWNQWTDWPSLLEAGVRADRLGYDTLWTWDHLYPIVGDSHGPIFEGWLTLAAWAQATERIRIGLMVGANTFREPTLTAKMATTLDHVSDGRAILGIGGAWFEEEHEDFGLEFGSGFPERLRWLGEALPIVRGMLDGTEPTATGPHYRARHTRNLPPPIQRHLPICIGGGGEKVTLKLVAKYADLNNVGGGVARVRRKEAILLEHCAAVGRDPAEIERTTGIGDGVHPRRPSGGGAPLPGGVPAEPDRTTLGGSAGRDPRGCGRDARAVPADRIPAPHRRCPGHV